ncbi:Sensor_kinase_SpoOB-type, alpha-helical domain [Pelagirhabdus alkalitolerans]|uniref:Sensor_kinase_SpoOB-type, alpha-helical domain n=1 Tax=Pelagirhabdus alkalitolerans TaxID=1612202 RepID=A0A1G6HRQ6_9BACI|nr:Spo0B domain-containing protein [Pelagirhabdus alkalitolerans]SDB96186.1 Sensor_kinase_SpoOB-type, alpha-helical domain [Pelagirhabdus alkalitolerans]
MEEVEVIQLLRHFRHDLANEVQLISGYLQLEDLQTAKQYSSKLNRNLINQQAFLSMPLPKTIVASLKSAHLSSLNIKFEAVIDQTPTIEDHRLQNDMTTLIDLLNNMSESVGITDALFIFKQYTNEPFELNVYVDQLCADIGYKLNSLFRECMIEELEKGYSIRYIKKDK